MWFAERYQQAIPPFYSSVDIRHSGQKLAPVDTNLFPAGFNNVTSINKAKDEIKSYLAKYFPHVKNILLIPEDHTRNLNYLENIVFLKNILEQRDIKVRVARISETAQEDNNFKSSTGQMLFFDQITVNENIITLADNFLPDLIILNNDLSQGIPTVLQHINQPIIPSPQLGWHIRRKSTHFSAYNQVLADFAEQFPIDPFLLSTLFERCDDVSFKEEIGIDRIAAAVDRIITALKIKYQQHNISDEPYVFIKADNGTYGMGIMTVNSPEELFELNKKLRNKMEVIKGGVTNNSVIIQEGIRTIDTVLDKAAEPMIYLIGGEPINYIYRVNTVKDEYSNLNSHGMHFVQQECKEELYSQQETLVSKQNSCEGVLSLVAKLATLAAVYEKY
jgi:glutamate--cysteine ligase